MISWIIVGVWVATMLVGTLGMIAYRFRYFYLQGRLRAEFITDRPTITRVVKLNRGAKNFDIELFGQPCTFGIDSSLMRLSGRERLPKHWYYMGRVTVDINGKERILDKVELYQPLNMDGVSVKDMTSATEYRRAARNNLVTRLADSFRKRGVDSTQALLITLGAIGIGIIALGIFINVKFEAVLSGQ